MKSVSRQFLTVLVTLLLLSIPAHAATAAIPGADDKGGLPTTVSLVRAKAVGTWRCGKFHHPRGSSIESRWCVRFSKILPRVSQDGQNLLHNKFRKAKMFHCSMSRSTTITWNVEGTVEAEAGVVFAKAKTSVTAGVAHSSTTTDQVGADFRIRGRHWAYCARGHAYFRIVGTTRKQICGQRGCAYNVGTRFNTRLPSSPFFEIGPGRNIDWTEFLPAR